MRLCVIGTGYVGLVTGTCLAESGNDVICMDVDAEKIAVLKQGILPIYEPGLGELIQRNLNEDRLSFTTDLAASIKDSLLCFIAVGTPEGKDGSADLSMVFGVAEDIARVMPGYRVVVIKSTVPVGTADRVQKIMQAYTAHPFDVVSNPEFLKEGAAVEDFLKPDRVVLGGSSKRALSLLKELYGPFVRTENPVLVMDNHSAEMSKYAANALLATRISFINEIARLCERVGADVAEVRRGIGFDRRIGHSFLFPGAGYGGSCFASDTTVFILNSRQVTARPFAELVDGSGEVIKVGEVEVLYPRPTTKVLSFDLTAGHSTLAEVHCLTRRWYEGLMVELKTRMGRHLRITADHPVVLYDRQAQAPRVVPVSDVQLGDCLIAVTALPDLEQTSAVNLLEALSGSELEPLVKVRPYDDTFTHIYPQFSSHVPHKLMSCKHDIKRKNYMPLPVYRYLRAHEHLEMPAENLRLFTTKGQPTYCPAQFVVDQDFMRLLGYYVAEGWISIDFGRNRQPRERVGFSFDTYEREYIADLHRILQRYGIRYLEKKAEGRTHATIIACKLLAYLLRDVLRCGTRSENAALPKLVFHVNEKLKLAFLQGAWSGDGAVTKLQEGRNLIYEYGTVSKLLAEGMALLLQSLGVVASIQRRWMNKSTQEAYIVRISGIEQLERLKSIFGPQRQAEIEKGINAYERRIAQSGFHRGDGFVTLEVTDVKVESTAEHVYSMETATSTLLTASGLVAHNCFPKDIRALVCTAEEKGLKFPLLRAVDAVNEQQKRFLVEKVKAYFGAGLQGRRFAIWGLAFKPRTDDMREAPAVVIVESLLEAGAEIAVHDPEALGQARRIFGPRVTYHRMNYDALQDADALLVVTEWNEFRRPDFVRMRALMREPVIFDGRNLYEPEVMQKEGFVYYAIGRMPVLPTTNV